MFYRNHNNYNNKAMPALCSVLCIPITLFAANVLQCFVNGEETPKFPLPFGFPQRAGG